MLCSELVNLHLRPRLGRERQLEVTLEEIWSSGAVLRTDERIALRTSLWFVGGGRKFQGRLIERTLQKGLGYFIEIRFQPNCLWHDEEYRPTHLFNPLVLLADRIFAAMPYPSVTARPQP
jgi:hypothetical protein